MKPRIFPLSWPALAAAGALTAASASAHLLIITVNSAGNDTTPDARLTLVEALAFLNDELAQVGGADAVHGLGRPLSVGELNQVEEVDADEHGGVVRFNLPGTGPHTITAPPGGFPVLFASHVTLDGYTQPGSAPNTNGILAANTARLGVVLDVRQPQPRPGTEEVADYTLQLRGRDIIVRGFSILSGQETETYGLYFGPGASGGQVSGCWFGISPDQQLLAGGEVAIAAYGSEGGHVIGTNGDGVNDRAEFNVIVAHAIGVQFEETRDVRVSGNFIGVMPDGTSLPPEEIRLALEGDAIEGTTLDGTLLVGTDANGTADDDERNVIGGMKDDVMEFYGPVAEVRVAGNYLGVGVDGTTPLPFGKLLRAQGGRFSIGTPATEMQVDARKANRIANGTQFLVRHRDQTYIALRGNQLTGNAGQTLHDLPEQSFHAQLLERSSDLVPVLEGDPSSMVLRGTVPLSGPGAQGLAAAMIDLALADPTTLPGTPQGARHLFSVMDNGMMDTDPAVGRFAVNLMNITAPTPGAHAVVATSTIRNQDGFETTDFSQPVTVTLAGAGPEGVLNQVPMQGPMIHVNFRHRIAASGSSLEVHLDSGIPALVPLSLSHAGASFDPAHPWYTELDPSQGARAFNRQYGFLLDGESDPLPAGSTLRIRQLSATPGLLVRRYRQSPPAWEPLFGEGAPAFFEWNLLMFHPAYAVSPGIRGPVEARYEAWVADAAGAVSGTPVQFQLVWTVPGALELGTPRVANGRLELEARVPTPLAGKSLHLERREFTATLWTTVASPAAVAGTNLLVDPNPPAAGALYRARVDAP